MLTTQVDFRVAKVLSLLQVNYDKFNFDILIHHVYTCVIPTHISTEVPECKLKKRRLTSTMILP